MHWSLHRDTMDSEQETASDLSCLLQNIICLACNSMNRYVRGRFQASGSSTHHFFLLRQHLFIEPLVGFPPLIQLALLQTTAILLTLHLQFWANSYVHTYNLPLLWVKESLNPGSCICATSPLTHWSDFPILFFPSLSYYSCHPRHRVILWRFFACSGSI